MPSHDLGCDHPRFHVQFRRTDSRSVPVDNFPIWPECAAVVFTSHLQIKTEKALREIKAKKNERVSPSSLLVLKLQLLIIIGVLSQNSCTLFRSRFPFSIWFIFLTISVCLTTSSSQCTTRSALICFIELTTSDFIERSKQIKRSDHKIYYLHFSYIVFINQFFCKKKPKENKNQYSFIVNLISAEYYSFIIASTSFPSSHISTDDSEI